MSSSNDQIAFYRQLLATVADISSRFVKLSSMHFEHSIQRSLAELGEVLGADRTYLNQWDFDEGEMGHVYEWQADGVDPIGSLWWRVSLDKVPWLRDQLLEGNRVCISSEDDIPESARAERRWFRLLPVQTLVLQPVYFDGFYSGILGASYFDEAIVPEDPAPMAIVANILANALEHQRQRGSLIHANNELRQLSEIDALTGIANRRVFDEKLQWECRRSARINGRVSVLIADVDYFKKYNDAYGHPEGDRCLKKIAQLLKDTFMREGEYPSRYGGEEFAVVCGHNIDPLNLFAQAQKWRQAVETLAIPHAGSKITEHVTISIGIASCVVSDTSDRKALLKRADEMLYIAKAEGRNRVVIGDSERWLADDVSGKSKHPDAFLAV